ncbi:BRCT domain-containing protein [Dyadobacter sediminis]|uniref:BRCT domain-containing protein n=1 Tax=Dyadobacter sediminis TaxID=1493691 RepID=UPI001487351D|nr:BRCT domain-containing protein [Dyadobacter sediminis]GGC16499.1 hypothetical protein GCM10011325_49050 [Dyadobacter sediminis]
MTQLLLKKCPTYKGSRQHHRAAADSRATAELSLRAFKIAGVASIDDFPEKLKTSVGELYIGGYRPCETKRVYKPKDLSKITGDPAKHNPESIFHGRTVVFTGTLSSMVRGDAQQIIADLGGVLGGGVTKETDFLIVGQQDYRVVGEEGMSTKQVKAVKMIQNGAKIEILCEADFLKSI